MRRILLDCGLFQGKRREAAAKNTTFAFNPEQDIDAVVLSHAHMDHVGRIPLLWKRGFRGKVHCTYATKDLAAVMLADGGYIQEKDEEYFCEHLQKTMLSCEGPLYTQEDARECMELFQGQNYEAAFEVCEGVTAQFLEAGHILGAAMVVLEIDVEDSAPKDVVRSSFNRFSFDAEEEADQQNIQRKTKNEQPSKRVFRLGFSGDLGRSMLPIIRNPSAMLPVDTLICESTYGNRKHEDVLTAKNTLGDVIIRTAARGGKIFIPAFSLERTQEIVYDLHVLWDEKKIPAIPIFIDSPLASRVTDIFMKHPECYNADMYEKFLGKGHSPFQFSLVKYTVSVEESKALNGLPGPAVIMAGSGMCEAGRIRHHLRNGIEDPRNTIVAVGYMAENTLGRRIIEPDIPVLRIFDRMYQKRAEVVYINAYSGHADKDDLDRYIAAVPGLRKVYLVHGEERGMFALAERTAAFDGDIEVVMPEREAVYDIL